MHNMAKGARARWLARVVCLLFAGSFVAVGPSAQRAAAQEVTTAFKILPVAVLDFVNKTDYQPSLLGRKAADAMVVALDAAERFEPQQRDYVDRALQELGLGLPLHAAAQQRLGKYLEVAGVISGEVRKVEFIEKREGLTARVTVGGAMVDVATGQPITGALVAVSSAPKPGYGADKDVLVNEALRQAAYEIVQGMMSYHAPQVMVSSADPNHAYLLGGTRKGIHLGLQMVVLRFGEKVGLIKITEVDAGNATGEIVENLRGITTGDKAVGVYRLPSQALTPKVQMERRETGRRLKRSKTGLIALLVGGLLWGIMSQRRSPGEEETRGVQASSLSNVLDYPEVIVALGTGANLITWLPEARDTAHTLAFWILRNERRIWAQRPEEGYYFIDPIFLGGLGCALAEGDVLLTVTIEVDEETGLLTLFERTIGAAEEEEEEEGEGEGEGEGEEMPPVIAWQDGGGGGPIGSSFTFEGNITPPIPGFSYTYQVTTMASVPRIGGGVGDDDDDTGEGEGEEMPPALPMRAGQVPRSFVIVESPRPGAAGPATAIVPPVLMSPIEGTSLADLSSVDFTFLATKGADQYILQVARNSQFLPAETVDYAIVPGFFPWGTERHLVVTDLASKLPMPTGGGSLSWRIGVRNSGDQLHPRLTPGVADLKPQDKGYVWSARESFLVGIATPAPTDDGTEPTPPKPPKPPKPPMGIGRR